MEPRGVSLASQRPCMQRGGHADGARECPVLLSCPALLCVLLAPNIFPGSHPRRVARRLLCGLSAPNVFPQAMARS
jgi:hypothetical protein